MIRLTPLAETTSGQELIKDERIALLTQMVRRKFALSDELTTSINQELQGLELGNLKELIIQILDISTVEQLETWIAAHLPEGGSTPLSEND